MRPPEAPASVSLSLEAALDRGLSFQALGVLTAGLCFPEGKVNREQLHGRRFTTVDDVNQALIELRRNGYVRDDWTVEMGQVRRQLQFFDRPYR